MGHSLYFPFPFRKRCLITIDTLESTDPSRGASSTRSTTRSAGGNTRGGARRSGPPLLGRRGGARPSRPGTGGGGARLESAPRTEPCQRPAPLSRSRVCCWVLTGPLRDDRRRAAAGGVIRTLRLRTPERDPARLRAIVVAISFDDEETVRAPLSDLFGSSPGLNPYESLPLSVSADGTHTSRFPMPFRTRAVVTVSQQTTPPAPVEFPAGIQVEPRPLRARIRDPARHRGFDADRNGSPVRSGKCPSVASAADFRRRGRAQPPEKPSAPSARNTGRASRKRARPGA